MASLPHRSDLDFFGLEPADDGRSGRFHLGSALVRHDGALYGGTGLAVSVAAMEAATERDILWASTQFVTQPYRGTDLAWTTEVLALGKRAAQLLVRATFDDTTAFVAVGSTGIAADDGLTGQYVAMPRVLGPEAAPPHIRAIPIDAAPEDSWMAYVEMREAQVVDASTTTVAFWTRMRDAQTFTPALLAFVADFVPVAVARAAGRVGAGASLDNSMRFRGGSVDTDWVLVDLEGEFSHGGYGHGTVRMWSESGELLATGSQTASMRYLAPPGEAWVPPTRPAG